MNPINRYQQQVFQYAFSEEPNDIEEAAIESLQQFAAAPSDEAAHVYCHAFPIGRVIQEIPGHRHRLRLQIHPDSKDTLIRAIFEQAYANRKEDLIQAAEEAQGEPLYPQWRKDYIIDTCSAIGSFLNNQVVTVCISCIVAVGTLIGTYFAYYACEAFIKTHMQHIVDLVIQVASQVWTNPLFWIAAILLVPGFGLLNLLMPYSVLEMSIEVVVDAVRFGAYLSETVGNFFSRIGENEGRERFLAAHDKAFELFAASFEHRREGTAAAS